MLGETYDSKFINEAMREFSMSEINIDSLTAEALAKFNKLTEGQFVPRQKLSMRTEGDFGKVSLRDVVRLVAMIQGNPTSEETMELRDKVARHLLVKVDVSFYLDDKKAGQMSRLTDPGQSLEADAFLQENWIFYQLVLDTTTGYVLKNFTAPPRLTPPAAGAVPGAGAPA